MKIYCILLDTCPLYPQLKDFSKRTNSSLSYQISNSHTASSVLAMLTGRIPSDLMDREHSIHKSWQRNQEDVYSKNFPWNKDTITQQLAESGWKTIFHNSHTIIKDVCSNDKYQRTTAYPGGLSEESTKWWDHHDIIQTCFSDSEKSQRFYADEIAHIKKFQQPNEDNEFYFIMYHQYHMAEQLRGAQNTYDIASSIMFSLLDQWDLNEPNSLFYIFADHGMYTHIDKFQNPPYSWYTWSIVKNNISSPTASISPLSSIMDFYPTIKDILGEEHEGEDCQSLYSSFDKDRIYFIEDSRFAIDDMKTTTAAAIQAIEWESDRPITFAQVSYHAPAQLYRTYIYETKNDNNVGKVCYPYPGSLIIHDSLLDEYEYLGHALQDKYKDLFR